MTPIHQTVFGDGKGNCFAACVASILELPIEAVPNFCLAPDWFQRARAFVGRYGLDLIYTALRPGELPFFAPGHWIATGKSPRGDFLHSVVCEGAEFRHDPHPDGTFLAGPIEDAILFTVVDPAVLCAGRRWIGGVDWADPLSSSVSVPLENPAMSQPSIRAKFKLNEVRRSLTSVTKKDADGRPLKNEAGHSLFEEKEIHTLLATPVYGNGDPNHENTKFWDASPGGELRLNCVNADVVARLQLGKEFYMDLTPAE